MADAWSPDRLNSISSAEEVKELAGDIQSIDPKEATKAAKALKAHYEKLKEQGVLQSVAEKEIKTLKRVLGMKVVKKRKFDAFRVVLKSAHDLLEKNQPPAMTIRSNLSDVMADMGRAKGTGTVVSPEETEFMPEMIKSDNVLSIIFGSLVDADKIIKLKDEGYAVKSPTQLRKIVQLAVTEPPFNTSIVGKDALNVRKIAEIIKTTDYFDKFAAFIKEALPKKPDKTPVTPVDSGTVSLREELEGEGGLDLGPEPEAETPPPIPETSPGPVKPGPEIDLELEEEPDEESWPKLSTETGDVDMDIQFDDLLGVIWGDETEEKRLEKLKKQGYKLGNTAQLSDLVENVLYETFKEIIFPPLERSQIVEVAKSTKDLRKIKVALIKVLSEAEIPVATEEKSTDEQLAELIAGTEEPVATEEKSINEQLEELIAETEKPKPEELMKAIKANDAKQVETYLSKGVALDFFDEENKTPLMRACAQGNFEIVSCIYEKGGPKLIQQKNKSGQTAFTEAIAHPGKGKERFQIVSLLRENVFDIDNINSWVPVELAIENGHKKINQYLIGTGAKAKPEITEAEVPPEEPVATAPEPEPTAPAQAKPKEKPKSEDEIMEEKAKEVAPEEYQEWCNYFEILHFGRLPRGKEDRMKAIRKRGDLLGTKSENDYRFLRDELRKANLRRFIDAKKPIIALREMSKKGETNVDNLKEKLNEKLTEVDEAIESLQLPMQIRRLEDEFQKAHKMAEKSADSMTEAEKQKHVERMEQWAEQFRQKIKLVKPEPAKEAPAPVPAPAKPAKAPDIVGLTNIVKNNETLMSLVNELEEIRQLIKRKEQIVELGITPKGFQSVEHFQNKLKKLEDNNDPLVRVKSRAQLIMEYLKIVKESDPFLFESWNPDESPKKLAEMLEKKWSKFLDILKK